MFILSFTKSQWITVQIPQDQKILNNYIFLRPRKVLLNTDISYIFMSNMFARNKSTIKTRKTEHTFPIDYPTSITGLKPRAPREEKKKKKNRTSSLAVESCQLRRKIREIPRRPRFAGSGGIWDDFESLWINIELGSLESFESPLIDFS